MLGGLYAEVSRIGLTSLVDEKTRVGKHAVLLLA